MVASTEKGSACGGGNFWGGYVAILTSNYCDEARRFHNKLEQMISFITQILTPDQSNLPDINRNRISSCATVKQEGDSDNGSNSHGTNEPRTKSLNEGSSKARTADEEDEDLLGQDTEPAGPVASREKGKQRAGKDQADGKASKTATSKEITRLPKLLLRDIGGHDCQCPACSPGYLKQLEDKALRRIYKDKTIELGEQTRKRVMAETHKEQADTLAKLRRPRRSRSRS